MFKAFYNPHLLLILNKLLNPAGAEDLTQLSEGSYGVEHIPSSSLYQIPIPEDLPEPKNYGSLFEYLAERGMIPIGLYRGVYANLIGAKNNRLPYVFTNPPADAQVYSVDRVFVLSQSPPRVATKVSQ